MLSIFTTPAISISMHVRKENHFNLWQKKSLERGLKFFLDMHLAGAWLSG
jgi:hypothetical protein